MSRPLLCSRTTSGMDSEEGRRILTEENLRKIYDELNASHSSGLSSQCDVQVIITESKDNDVDTVQYQRPAYVAVGLIMAMTGISVFFPMIVAAFGVESIYVERDDSPCSDPCRFTLVESIPVNLTYPPDAPVHVSTYATWHDLINSANQSIDIASFYWTLKGSDIGPHPTDVEGEQIFTDLQEAGRRGIKIRIAQNVPTKQQPQLDTRELAKYHLAEVRSLNFSHWFGGGVLHTKFFIVDGRHFYVGSANMDWRSLTQVKELGLVVQDCSCLVEDLQKVFEVYWYLGRPGTEIPTRWPSSLTTRYNSSHPAAISLNGSLAHVYLSSSPKPFCPDGRTPDLDAILDVIYKAEKFVHIAVMDYFPMLIYTEPNKFWPVIDDALRRVAIDRGVNVRILASWWKHSRKDLGNYLLSLAALDGANSLADIQVKLFHVPESHAQERIPYIRVNHNKYMVTDNIAYIGTSNWSGDYFTQTGGVGVIVSQKNISMETDANLTLQEQLAAVFERDWNSSYAQPVRETLALYNITREYDNSRQNFMSGSNR